MSDFDAVWGAYFTRTYGPDWRNKRRGRPLLDKDGNCNCWFCKMTEKDKADWKRQHGGAAETHK